MVIYGINISLIINKCCRCLCLLYSTKPSSKYFCTIDFFLYSAKYTNKECKIKPVNCHKPTPIVYLYGSIIEEVDKILLLW